MGQLHNKTELTVLTVTQLGPSFPVLIRKQVSEAFSITKSLFRCSEQFLQGAAAAVPVCLYFY